MIPYLRYNVRPLPTEKRLPEHVELQPQLAHIVGYPKTISQCCHPVHHIFICIRYETLAELVLSVHGEIEDTSHRVLRQKSLFVEVNNPIVVRKYVDRILQAILKSSCFEQSPRSRPIGSWHDDFSHSAMLLKIDGFVGNHFDQEVFQARFRAFGHVSVNVGSYQFRIIAPRYYPDTNERR